MRLRVKRQEQSIEDLTNRLRQAELRGGPTSGNSGDVEMDVRMQHEAARAEALSVQMQNQALQHAREVQQLKL